MAIKPSPTIAGKLRKLFSNNKQTIEPAIDDTLPGGGGSGGGGVFLISYDHSEQVVDPNNKETTTIYVYDKTFSEANEAIRARIPVYVYTANDELAVLEYVEGSRIQGPGGTLFEVFGNVLMYSVPGMADGKLFRADLPHEFINSDSNPNTK